MTEDGAIKYSTNLYLLEFGHYATGFVFGFLPYCWIPGIIYACWKEWWYDPKKNCGVRWLWLIQRHGQGVWYQWGFRKRIWMGYKGWLDWCIINLGIAFGLLTWNWIF